ncbi:MAG: hypothetical protein HOH95_08340 [Dehalococcoidia bacterium]|nr:hypothetical protein [Dehalococcoidia bacterium]
MLPLPRSHPPPERKPHVPYRLRHRLPRRRRCRSRHGPAGVRLRHRRSPGPRIHRGHTYCRIPRRLRRHACRRRSLRRRPQPQARPAPQRRLRQGRHRGRPQRWRPRRQQRRSQLRRRLGARTAPHARRLSPAHRAPHQRHHRSLARRDHPRIHELRGKTLGIVGLGTIGKKTARLAAAFGMPVTYYDIARLPEDQEDALNVRFRLLRELLRTSDIVTLHTPLNPSTHHLIGADELSLMKPDAILINTARGPIVDEAALCDALTSGTIAGAGLDVFDQEPPPADNPLFALGNVVLTPHLAGPTFESNTARVRNAFDNVQRVARGDLPLWVIPELAE